MELDDTKADGVMPSPIDVRGGVENRRQRAMVEAALFDEPAEPIKIGRFTVVRRLGAGGMGVVYMAYDEQLDRRVAVKLLSDGGDEDAEARGRLQREAQAMAKLAHPNVVAVHEVGLYEGQVFVAMEYVAGGDMRAWLGERERPWREVLAHFIQAGHGLAAAHGAGLVHRDFKPDNVLVGEDGRVRVADFGLARGRGSEPEAPTEAPDTELAQEKSGQLARPLTATGAVLGTPAYMAPEQIRGEPADARADQFGFCVALYEGLYGQRPFNGETVVELWAAVEAGEVGAPPNGSAVPGWLRAAVVRGLSPEAEARWPSMQALLGALGNDPDARRRRRIRAASIVGLVLAVVTGSVWLAAGQLQQAARQRFWAALGEHQLEIERELQTRKAEDEAVRARDSARMSAADRFRPAGGPKATEDPTAAAALLRDVEGQARASPRWVAQANETLGKPISAMVLGEHRDLVHALVFDPEALVLYSASADGTVRRWALEQGSTSTLVHRHDGGVTTLAVDPSGRWLAWGGVDRQVGLWRTDGSAPPRLLAGHEGPVRAVAFDPTGRRVVSTSDDGTARLWAVDTGASTVLDGHGGAVTSAAFDDAAERVATASKGDFAVRLWRARDGALLHTLRGHTNDVFHVRSSGPDRWVSADDDGVALLWTPDRARGWSSEVVARHAAAITSLDAHAGRFLTTGLDRVARVWNPGGDEVVLRGHTGEIWMGRFTPDGRHVVTTGRDRQVRVYAAGGGEQPRVLEGHRMGVMSEAIDADGRWLATGSFDGVIRLWDLSRPATRWRLRGHRDRVWAAALDLTRRRVVTVSHDGTARVWSLDTGTAVAVLEPPEAADEALDSVAITPDGRTVATGSSHGRVRLWDVDSGETRLLDGHTGAVWHLAFDAEGKRLASGSFDGTARLWDPVEGRVLHVLGGDEQSVIGGRVYRVAFSGDGQRLYTAGDGGALGIWDVATGQGRAANSPHSAGILELAVAPGGRGVATASKDTRAKIWLDPERGEPIELSGHQGVVRTVRWSADGRWVLTASDDGTARAWSAEDGQLLSTFEGDGGQVWDALPSADDRWIFTASEDGKVRAWARSQTRGPVVEWSHQGAVLGLSFDAAGQQLVSISADHTAGLWSIEGLGVEPSRLQARLDEATKYCVPAPLRMRELGEDEAEAEAAVARCRERGTL